METKEALQAQITELRLANERFAHLPEKFDKLAENVMAELRSVRAAPAAPAAPDHMALAMHRFADIADSFRAAPKQPQSGGANSVLMVLAVVGALAIGFTIAGFLT